MSDGIWGAESLVLEIEFQFRGAVDAQYCGLTNIDVESADTSISIVEIEKRVDLFRLCEGEWREVVISKDDGTHSHSFSCDVHEVGKTIGNQSVQRFRSYQKQDTGQGVTLTRPRSDRDEYSPSSIDFYFGIPH